LAEGYSHKVPDIDETQLVEVIVSWDGKVIIIFNRDGLGAFIEKGFANVNDTIEGDNNVNLLSGLCVNPREVLYRTEIAVLFYT